MTARKYSQPTIKKLFALSHNECAMDECHAKLADPGWKTVRARICHIRAHSVGGPRFDPSYEAVDDFDNLLLLCPNHHTSVDDTEPDNWSVDKLLELKARHQLANRHRDAWSPDDVLGAYAQQLIAIELRLSALDASAGRATRPARLIARPDGSDVIVQNIGGAAAHRLSIIIEPDHGSLKWAGPKPDILRGGEQWLAMTGLAPRADGPYEFTLHWDDNFGHDASELSIVASQEPSKPQTRGQLNYDLYLPAWLDIVGALPMSLQNAIREYDAEVTLHAVIMAVPTDDEARRVSQYTEQIEAAIEDACSIAVPFYVIVENRRTSPRRI